MFNVKKMQENKLEIILSEGQTYLPHYTVPVLVMIKLIEL
jgi:hypothetical protein